MDSPDVGTPTDITRSLRIPVIQTPKYTVFLQAIHINDVPYTFTHADVLQWDKTTLRELRSDWNCLVDLHNGPLLALNEVDDEKHRHFLGLFDFTYLQQLTGDDGVVRNLFINNRVTEPQEN